MISLKKLAAQKGISTVFVPIEKLNKLVWSVGGSVIFILASALLAGVLR